MALLNLNLALSTAWSLPTLLAFFRLALAFATAPFTFATADACVEQSVEGGGVVFGATTLKLRVAGDASVLARASVARTENVCAPSGSTAVVWVAPGPEHGPNAAPSTLHAKVAPASGELNPNVGVVSSVVAPVAGPDVIEVSGAVVSTVNDEAAGVGSVLPAASVD